MEEHGHGHSIAAWTGVLVLMVASVLLAVGVFFAYSWATWAGLVLVVLGVGAWVGLNAAGYNQQHWESRLDSHDDAEASARR